MSRPGSAKPPAPSPNAADRMTKSSRRRKSYACLLFVIMTISVVLAAFQFIIELHPDALPIPSTSEAGGGAGNVATASRRTGTVRSGSLGGMVPGDTQGGESAGPAGAVMNRNKMTYAPARRDEAALDSLSPLLSRNITRIIWQTSRNSTLPAEALDYARTWTDKNPGWSHRILSDADMIEFFRTEFTHDPRVYDAFRSLPLGVMKADMFRVGIVYRRGGVYADIDTECVVPIDTWWPNEESDTGSDGKGGEGECGAYISTEGSNLCNWAMAAPRPGHPVFERALYRIVEGVESYGGNPIKVTKGLVLSFTGPGSLTRAVAEALRLERIVGPGRMMRQMLNGRLGPAGKNQLSGGGMLKDEKALTRAKEIKLCLKEKAFFGRDKVKHHYGAMLWKDSALYKSWKKEVASLAS